LRIVPEEGKKGKDWFGGEGKREREKKGDLLGNIPKLKRRCRQKRKKRGTISQNFLKEGEGGKKRGCSKGELGGTRAREMPYCPEFGGGR